MCIINICTKYLHKMYTVCGVMSHKYGNLNCVLIMASTLELFIAISHTWNLSVHLCAL